MPSTIHSSLSHESHSKCKNDEACALFWLKLQPYLMPNKKQHPHMLQWIRSGSFQQLLSAGFAFQDSHTLTNTNTRVSCGTSAPWKKHAV